MGYYIEVPKNKGKAKQIVKLYGGRILDKAPTWDEVKEGEAIICVINNFHWEGALFAYSENELIRAMPTASDNRQRTWLIMDRKKACKLTGYQGDMGGY